MTSSDFVAESHGGRHPRRAILRSLAGVGLVVTRVPMRTLAQEATPAGQPAAPGATYVGETSEPGIFVALIVPLDEAAAGEAHAYLCDGQELTLWFTGAAGEELALTAAEGATLTGRPADESASGEVMLPDGRSLSITAGRAEGIAGLYDVVLADGTVRGAAGDGQRLEGQVVEELANGSGLLAGTIAHRDGKLHAFATFVSAEANGEMRWIVLADGRLTGGRQKDKGSGWINPDSQP